MLTKVKKEVINQKYMRRGEISIPLAIAISLVGSVVVAISGYYKTVSSQEVNMTQIRADISANTVRDNGQDKRIDGVTENMNIMNENISELMRKNGLIPKPLKI